MRAIILAAGRDRIAGYPACLVPFGDQSSLERQIKIFSQVGVDDVSVVIGRDAECWRPVFVNQVKAMAVKVVENPNNDRRGNAESLRMALEEWTDEYVLISDGDTVFDRETLSHVINNRHDNLMLIRPTSHLGDSGTRVILDGERVNLIGKKTYKENSTWEMYGGLIKLCPSAQALVYKGLSGRQTTDEFFTSAINELIMSNDSTFYLHAFSPNNRVVKSLLKGGSYAGIKKYSLVRKETKEWKEKLVDEVRWLRNLPEEISDSFTRVLNHGISQTSAFYEMPYYPFPSLRELLFSGSMNSAGAVDVLMQITSFLFDEVYSRNREAGPKDYCQRIHLGRMAERLRETARKSATLDKIINASYCQINGVRYRNLPEIYALLGTSTQLISLLSPPNVSMVHGDLHFDNVLINQSDESEPPFIFVDPRGLDKTFNYSYDLAKLWHSFHGLYDLIHEGLFELSITHNLEGVEANFKCKPYPVLGLYQDIHCEYVDALRNSNMIVNDRFWEIRTLFAEASHFCSVMPFHLKYDGEESTAIALYLTGVLQMNKILEIYLQNVVDNRLHETRFLEMVSTELESPRRDDIV